MKLIQNIRINTIEGENVDKVVSLIRGGTERLSAYKDPDTKQSPLPLDYNRTLLEKVLQSSSVTAFNKKFELIQEQLRILAN